MKLILAALGAALVAVAALGTWFQATTLTGSATMSAWGQWSRTGAIDADLRLVPIGLVICIPAGWAAVAALRPRYGQAFLATIVTAVLSVLTVALKQRVAASAPGGDAVFVVLGPAPQIVLGLALAAAVCSWYLYARTELRERPQE